MSANAQVSWIQFTIPALNPGVPIFSRVPLECKKIGCGCERCCGKIPMKPAAPLTSEAPIRYATGEIVHAVEDLDTEGFGVPWGHTRTFGSRLTAATNAGNGYSWQVSQWSYLAFQSDNSIVVMGDVNEALWFDLVGENYVPRFNVRQSLLFDRANNLYRLVDLDGSVTVYDGSKGVFRSHSDPAGNQIAVVGYTANGFNFTEVQRSYTSGGTTTVESFLYTYQDPGLTHPLFLLELGKAVGAGSGDLPTP